MRGSGLAAHRRSHKEFVVLKDLAALTPPLVVAAAFLIAVGAFLRREMRPRRGRAEDRSDISGAGQIADRGAGGEHASGDDDHPKAD
jgi:hypothetical protein